MAGSAKLMRSQILVVLDNEESKGTLHQQLNAFKKVLIPDLDDNSFSDMYAQTICYGLFAARCNHDVAKTPFTRKNAAWDLPATNPFLRKAFNHIAGPDLDERVAWVVDDLAELLGNADIVRIMMDFGKKSARDDAVVHFYETFLSVYDPTQRELRGVFYTPAPVVSFIVRSVDALLQKKFAIADGLADDGLVNRRGHEPTHRVQVLDPAVGTGTFLYHAIEQIQKSFEGSPGVWPAYVSEHLLPRIFGFELLMAPYAVAHMKLGLQLARSNCDLSKNERLGIYLTNALEASYETKGLPLFASWVAEEADAASAVKRDAPVMIVLGNPPYSGTSANHGEWIKALLKGQDLTDNSKTESYFHVDGKPLKEKQKRWLHDDYVKFIRFGQWRIGRTGQGILAFITNHRYLRNVTFRGMRQSLLSTFDSIYIVDLHGNSKEGETPPANIRDENVFDIQQGVAISIFVKDGSKKPGTIADVWRTDVWGPRDTEGVGKRRREGKYDWLAANDVTSVKWIRAYPKSPHYSFESGGGPKSKNNYNSLVPINEIFPFHSSGFIAGNGEILQNFDRAVLKARIERLRARASAVSTEQIRAELECGDDVDLENLRIQLRKITSWEDCITRYLDRPFDERYIYYHNKALVRAVEAVHKHLIRGPNLAMIVSRQTPIFRNVFVTDKPVGFNCLASAGVYGAGHVFPLYLYQSAEESEQGSLFTEKTSAPTANLSDDFVSSITDLGLHYVVHDSQKKGDFSPRDIFHYIYGILFTPTYRATYGDDLKKDFPRIPEPDTKIAFQTIAGLGGKLVNLHLGDSNGKFGAIYPNKGTNRVEKVIFEPSKKGFGSVRINEKQAFVGVSRAAWDYQIGRWEPAQSYLEERQGRSLSASEVQTFRKTLSCLVETMDIEKKLDTVYRKFF